VKLRRLLLLFGVGAVATAAVRHVRSGTTATHAEGGILIGDTAVYDGWSRYLFGAFYSGIAADVAALAPPSARVLDVGCGTGQLSIRLAQRGLTVNGLDLDPHMIERAQANSERAVDRAAADGSKLAAPEFVVGDAASLPFADASFDVVVSTLSLHHWDDPTAGLAEIARVLRPTGRALIWDLRPGMLPFHGGAPDPLDSVHGAPLRLVAATPWRWPWRLKLSQRIELVPLPAAHEHAAVKPRRPRRPRKAATASGD
jgi:SAM-dependent methyltransferase